MQMHGKIKWSQSLDKCFEVYFYLLSKEFGMKGLDK